ncbi:MAG: non-homologous end-joining DNA ligase [Opitutaceae bacterium]
MPARKTSELKIEGHTLTVSSLDKILYPSAGFTKGDVIAYYIGIGPVLLPHLKSRPITLKRYPDGVGKFFFYEKSCPPYRPRWVSTAKVFSKRRGGDMDYCVVNNLASLVWLANLADLELHTSLARAPAVARPTMMVFDLDPGEGADILACARVAFWLREKLQRLKLDSFPKTSGSKGIQLYVPLNTPSVTFDYTKVASRQIADAVAADHPDAVVTNMLKTLRKKKVLIDWSQNDDHKTTINVYSLRATEKPQISTPLTWPELEKLAKRGDADAFRFSPADVLARVKKHGDLFEPVLKLKQKLG